MVYCEGRWKYEMVKAKFEIGVVLSWEYNDLVDDYENSPCISLFH